MCIRDSMKIAIITSAPDMIENCIESTILRKAVESKNVEIYIVDIRDFSESNYKQIDDTPFGGGDGMVLMAGPLIKSIESSFELLSSNINDTHIVYPSPHGQKWTQEAAENNIDVDNFIFICGRYKGVDQRVIDKYVTHEYSIGDYVVSNGELSSLVMIDSIVRLNPGTLNNINSAKTDSFSSALLDYPHYTKPRTIDGLSVPQVLLEGHHEKIKSWRKSKSEDLTKQKRPDLWKKYNKTINQMEFNHE